MFYPVLIFIKNLFVFFFWAFKQKESHFFHFSHKWQGKNGAKLPPGVGTNEEMELLCTRKQKLTVDENEQACGVLTFKVEQL